MKTEFNASNKLCQITMSEVNEELLYKSYIEGKNAVYVEKDGQLYSLIDLESFIKNRKVEPNTDIAFISKKEYQTAKDQSELFKRTRQEYLPVLEDGHLIGEIAQWSSRAQYEMYWDLIKEDIYRRYFHKRKFRLININKNETVTELHEKLRALGIVSEETGMEKEIILFERKSYVPRIFSRLGKQFITIQYLYYRLLLQSLLEFYKEHDIGLCYLRAPLNNELPIEVTKKFYERNINDICEDSKALEQYYGENANRKYWENKDFKQVSVIRKGIAVTLRDCTSETYNVIDGKRYTPNHPKNYSRTLHCHGPCIIRGAACNDASTIPSYIQNKLNEKYKEGIRVLNYGVGGARESIYYLHNLYQDQYSSGDIVLLAGVQEIFHTLLFGLKEEYNVCYINGIDLLNEERLPENSLINCFSHCNHIANKVIAEFIEEKMIIPHTQKKEYNISPINGVPQSIGENLELEEYKKKLIENRVIDKETKNIGGIIMNCNPFTLGHLYLIKKSLEVVDYLYIFVVEEDQSYFSFHDRFQLVKENCAVFKNVCVLPSGRYMISALTFPEYFYKDEKNEVEIDPSQDIEYFGKEIAPILNIKYRFVGEEPLDKVTAQYNECMKNKLGQYGIALSVIPRAETEGELISASKVRMLIEKNKIEETKRFLTPITYAYIQAKFTS